MSTTNATTPNSSRWSLAWVLALFCVCAIGAGAQQPAVSSSPQPLTSGTAAIVVDAVVHDRKGNPLTDLRKEDFVLLEDGVRQEIGDVTVVGTAPLQHVPAHTESGASFSRPAAASPAPAARTTPSFVALVFDQLSPEARGLAYKGALAAIDRMQPGDYVAVYLSDLSLITLQTYTTDREKVRAALDKVARHPSTVLDRNATSDVLSSVSDRGDPLPGDADPSVPIVASAEFVGRPVDGRTLEDREIKALSDKMKNSWDTMARDQQGYATTNALLAITSALGTLPGRKTLVFFAEGIAIPAAVRPHFWNVIATANRGGVSVYTVDSGGLRVHSADEATTRAIRTLGVAGLRGMTDLANMPSPEELMAENPRTGLAMLAEQTGGFLVENTNDLAGGFNRIDADRRFYYLLTYAPRNTTFDGKWRSITVKVPSRNVAVRARSGYLAVRTPAGVPLLAYEGPALAALNRTPAPADLPLRSAVFVFPGGLLALLAATDAAALAFERDDKAHTYRTDFTILARIVDGSGQIVRKASQPYRLKGPAEQMDQAQRGEILFFRQPSLAPGRYTLEVALHDALTTRASVQRQALLVPESAPNTLQVSSLIIVQRTERVKPEEQQKGNPLYAGDVLVYPNLGEPIRKSLQKTLPFYVVVMAGPGAPPQATIEVSRDDHTLAQVPVTLNAPDASGRIAQIASLPIEGFAAGVYTLRLTMTQGDRREVREARLEIRN